MSRKIVLNLAISLDGFIADLDGGFDWITGDGDTSCDTKNKFVFEEFIKSIDVVVMGKSTFLSCPKETLDSFKSHKIYVATSSDLKTPYSNVTLIKEDIVSKILLLKEQEGKDIWIFGGAILADDFIKADVIDEFIVGFIPIILGKGKPLFLGNNPLIKLHLLENIVQEGIIISRYSKR